MLVLDLVLVGLVLVQVLVVQVGLVLVLAPQTVCLCPPLKVL